MRFFFFVLIVGFLSSTLFSITATTYAASTSSLEVRPVQKESLVETINTLKPLKGISKRVEHNGTAFGVFTLPFSVKAFGGDISFPAKVTRDANPLDPTTLGFSMVTREGELITDGIALGALLRIGSTTPSDATKLTEGAEEILTLLVVYTDTPTPGRDDRVRITHLPLSVQNTKRTIFLNQSELQKLRTGFVRLSTSTQ